MACSPDPARKRINPPKVFGRMERLRGSMRHSCHVVLGAEHGTALASAIAAEGCSELQLCSARLQPGQKVAESIASFFGDVDTRPASKCCSLRCCIQRSVKFSKRWLVGLSRPQAHADATFETKRCVFKCSFERMCLLILVDRVLSLAPNHAA